MVHISIEGKLTRPFNETKRFIQTQTFRPNTFVSILTKRESL